MTANKKIETYEKILTTLENIIAFERQSGFIKAMLQDEAAPVIPSK
jgi:hypothetical protein